MVYQVNVQANHQNVVNMLIYINDILTHRKTKVKFALILLQGEGDVEGGGGHCPDLHETETVFQI